MYAASSVSAATFQKARELTENDKIGHAEDAEDCSEQARERMRECAIERDSVRARTIFDVSGHWFGEQAR